ncbi:MAG: hypothetical protein E6Q76_12955 [Rhizobium sp.]|nr:MAG: hypothetical protein E6Q76_12955 [Rhizobium sp.]
MTHAKKIPFPVLKRSTLRKARQRIAAGSITAGERPFNSTVTRVVPVKDPVSDQVWAVAREAAMTLRGFGQGSLFDMLIHLHADGFRLFPSGREREAFFLKDLFDPTEFDDGARRAFGDVMPGFTANSLREILGAPARKCGKVTSVEILLPRLSKGLGVKKSAAPPEVLSSLAAALCEAFPTWSLLTAVDGGVGKVIDDVLRTHGSRLPSLEKAWSTNLPEVPKGLGVPTLAFDDQAPAQSEQTPTGRFAGVVARYLAETFASNPEATAGDASKAVQAKVTTPNGNALSWLFAVGRRAMCSTTLDELAIGLNITSPRGRHALSSLKERMMALPALSVLGERAYPDSRATLQGTVDSLIANYVNRLFELSSSATSIAQTKLILPAAIQGDTAVFDGMPFSAEDVGALFEQLPSEIAKLEHAVKVLVGKERTSTLGYQKAVDDVDEFGVWASSVDAVIGQINARLKTLERAQEPLGKLMGDGKLKRLVNIHEPEGPAVEIIPVLDQELQDVLTSCRTAFADLEARYPMTVAKAQRHAEAEVRNALELASRKEGGLSLASADVPALAKRKILEPIISIARRSSPAMATAVLTECLRQKLIVKGTGSERSLRGYVLSGEQVIYAHPLSRRRSIVRLDREGLQNFDALEFLDALQKDATQRTNVRESLIVEMARQSLLLSALPDRIEIGAISWQTPSQNQHAPWANLRPVNGTVGRSETIKSFTAVFHSRISGLLYRLNRQKFMEKYDLRCFIGSTLLFSPKNADWAPPPQYRHGRFSALLARSDFPWEGAEGTHANAVRLAKFLIDETRNATDLQQAIAAKALLAQLPHDWVVCCDFDGAPSYEGAFVSAGEVSAWAKRSGYLLTPPRHFAGAFLEGFKSTKISPHGLTFERMLERDGDSVIETGRRVTAAFPITQEVAPAAQPWKPRHLAGLDLGEAGLGVCLKNLDNGHEQTLLLKTRKTRLLAHSAEHYRRKDQPRQVFRKQYNQSSENAIKAAIGEVCGLIDNLIARYDAVPVFESQAAAARGSNRMVARVYAGVLQRYTYVVGNGAADATRTSHWLGANRWSYSFGADVIPKVRDLSPEVLRSIKKPENVFRDALGFPGVLANAWRTSMICSVCGTDPIGALEEAIAANQISFVTDNEGEGSLDLGDGRKVTLRVEVPTSSALTKREASRRKRRAPWEAKVGTVWTLTRKSHRDDLLTTIRRSLRRPSSTFQGSTTKQWEFHCPCCGQIQQADVNAASNLVRRYFVRASDNARARQHWADDSKRLAFIASMGPDRSAREEKVS